jgi:hypothetical protein
MTKICIVEGCEEAATVQTEVWIKFPELGITQLSGVLLCDRHKRMVYLNLTASDVSIKER